MAAFVLQELEGEDCDSEPANETNEDIALQFSVCLKTDTLLH